MNVSGKAFQLIWLLLWLLPQADPDHIPDLEDSGWTQHSISEGVELYKRHFDDLFESPQYISIIVADLEMADIEIGFAAASQFGRTEMELPELAEEALAIAAVNGGFMHGKKKDMNSGILKIDNEIFPFFQEEPEELSFVGSSALVYSLSYGWNIVKRQNREWNTEKSNDWIHAMAGGHLLIVNQEIHHLVKDRDWRSERERNHAAGRHPRTAVGLLPGNRVALLTVDGRHEEAAGMTLKELALVLKQIGSTDAINMDGGGSSTMWTSGQGVVNHPSGNEIFDKQGLRKIRSAIIISHE